MQSKMNLLVQPDQQHPPVMDKYTEAMLAKTGLIGMVGKAERGPAAIESIK